MADDDEKDGKVKSLEDGHDVKTANDDDGHDDVMDFFVEDDGDVKGSKNKKKNRRKGLPPFLDHFNARDLKILFKCSVAVWILTIFIFIDETLRAIGQAAFFGW